MSGHFYVLWVGTCSVLQNNFYCKYLIFSNLNMWHNRWKADFENKRSHDKKLPEDHF